MLNQDTKMKLLSACQSLYYDVALDYLESCPPITDSYSKAVDLIFKNTIRSYDLIGCMNVSMVPCISRLIYFELYYYSLTNNLKGLKFLTYSTDSQYISRGLYDYRDYYGNGILLNVCILGHTKILVYLLDYCNRVGLRPVDDNKCLNSLVINPYFKTTVFHMAAKYGRFAIMHTLFNHDYSRVELLPFVTMKSLACQSILDYAADGDRDKLIALMQIHFYSRFDILKSFVNLKTHQYLRDNKSKIVSNKELMIKESCQLFFANKLLACASKVSPCDREKLVHVYINCCDDAKNPSVATFDDILIHRDKLETKSLYPMASHSCMHSSCYFSHPKGRTWISDFIRKSAENVFNKRDLCNELNIVFFGSGWLQREVEFLQNLSSLISYKGMIKPFSKLTILCVDTIYGLPNRYQTETSFMSLVSMFYKQCFNKLTDEFYQQISQLNISDALDVKLVEDIRHGVSFSSTDPVIFVSLDFDVVIRPSDTSFDRYFVFRDALSHLLSQPNPLFAYLAIQLFTSKLAYLSDSCSTNDPVSSEIRTWLGSFTYADLHDFFSIDFKSDSDSDSLDGVRSGAFALSTSS